MNTRRPSPLLPARRAVALTLALALTTAALMAAGGCDSAGGGDSAEWLRQPLEVGWAPGEPPRVLYTAAVDSRDEHTTVLQVATAGDPIAFDQAVGSDANGNPPALPGAELTRAYWLWSPTGVALGERTHVFAIAEEASGQRALRRVSWTGTPDDAVDGAVGGTNGVIAYAVVPCDGALCVVAARATEPAGPTDIALVRLDETGAAVGDPATVARVDGVARSVHAVLAPPAAEGDPPAALDVFVVTCEGCGGIDFDDYEAQIYDVTARVWHVATPLDGADAPAPTEALAWGGLVDAASAAPTADGAALLYWRTAAEDAPDCTSQGHCPIDRALVPATWTRGEDALVEGEPLATSEVAHLQTLAPAADELRALWRVDDAEDGFLRDLRFGGVAAGAAATTVAATYTPLLLRSELSDSPAAVPFDYVDGLAATDGADGTWVALRYRDLPPGGAQVCGETVRGGVWTAQLAADGLVATASDDRASLVSETDCGGGSCAAAPGAAGASPAPLALLLLLLVALRRARAEG